MSKRFRDREIWQKPWYRKLSPEDRGAWDYLADRCDNVGVWVPDFEAAKFYINGKPDWENLPGKCNGNIKILDSGKWFLVDFCRFQYGELKQSNRAHASYLALLRKHGINELVQLVEPSSFDENKALISPLLGANINIVLDTILILGEFKNVKLSDFNFATLTSEFGVAGRDALIAKLSAYKETTGKRYKSDMGAIRQWVIAAVKDSGGLGMPMKSIVSGRSDAWTAKDMAEYGKELEDALPASEEEMAEVRDLVEKARDTPGGRLMAAVMKTGP